MQTKDLGAVTGDSPEMVLRGAISEQVAEWFKNHLEIDPNHLLIMGNVKEIVGISDGGDLDTSEIYLELCAYLIERRADGVVQAYGTTFAAEFCVVLSFTNVEVIQPAHKPGISRV